MNELLIDLDVHAKTALYEQIYEYIRTHISDGRLSCGERLPSTRLLAANLQISRSTVEAAYEQLVSEGYLEARPGSGYYVCDVGALYGVFKGHGALPRAAGGKKQEAREKIRYNFLPGQIDSVHFPYSVWRRVNKEAILEMERDMVQAGHPQGEYAFRRTIADYLYQARGAVCAPERLIVGAGNEYLLQLLGQVIGPGRRVAMESPTYLQAYETFRNMGYEVDAVPMDGDGMLVSEIPQDGTCLAYVMPSHQFPLGTVMPLKRRLQLLAWAEEKEGRYIIEDDHDSEFRYKGKPIPSLQSLAGHGRVIYLGTFSNSIMPSIRISYMALPQELMEAYHEKCGFYASTVSKIQQMAVCRFMVGGYFGRHLNKMRGVYKEKRDHLIQLLRGRKWVKQIYGDHAGLHIVAELSCACTERALITCAAEDGIKLQGMSDCYIAGAQAHGRRPVLLLGFGNLTEKELSAGVEALDQCVEKAEKMCEKIE